MSAAWLGSLRRAMTPAEWRRLGWFGGVILLLHLVGWGVFLAFAARYPRSFGIWMGATAYLFGLRHAFDADHISAIDNTTRKLMADGKRPLGTGFFFSLGHSTVVLGLTVALAFAAQRIVGQVEGDSSTLHNTGSLIGTGVSGAFLYLIGVLNLVILLDILGVFRAMRRGEYDEAALERRLQDRGFMNRFFGRLSRSITESWHMYPLGFLFGLGFDTASEVGLLAIGAGAATSGVPFWAVLSLPVIFAAGMAMMDTADGAFMTKAYGWAFSQPVRKVYYNITVTGLSVAVALLVGTVELLAVVQNRLGLHGGAWDAVATVGGSLNVVGLVIVALFVVTWAGSYLVWKVWRIEERWALQPVAVETEELRRSA
jgi:nickel/cobalt transporter (NiCoT) family protein